MKNKKKSIIIFYFLFLFIILIFNILFNSKIYPYVDSLKNKFNSKNTSSNDKLVEFYDIHKALLKKNDSLKRIIFNGFTTAGYGNKLYSFISSLIIAILTESQIVVRWKHIDKYISSPLDIFLQVDECVGLNYDELYEKSYHLNASQPWILNKNLNILMKTTIPTGYLRYFYRSIDPLFMEICSNPIYFEKLRYYNLVEKDTINSALQAIRNKNSSDDLKKDKIFQIGFEVGGNLLNKIWTPNKIIQDEINEYLNKYFKNNIVIGMQLRYGDDKRNRVYLNGINETMKMIECAQHIEKDYKITNKSILKWFVTSDSDYYTNFIKKKYPQKVFTSKGKIAHVHFDPDGYKRAIIDVELLSHCNEIIITGGSTFGWLASMKSLKLPFYLNGFVSMKKCLRARLSYPPHTLTKAGVF